MGYDDGRLFFKMKLHAVLLSYIHNRGKEVGPFCSLPHDVLAVLGALPTRLYF